MNTELSKARDGVLEAALEERYTGESPPELWSSIQSRLDSAAQPTRPRSAMRWLSAAAILLAGLGVTFAISVTRRSESTRRETPTHGPENLQQLSEWIRENGITSATAMTVSLRDLAGGREVPLRAHLLEGMLSDLEPTFALDAADRAALAEALLAASRITPPNPRARLGTPQHLIRASSGPHKFELRITGCGDVPAPELSSVSFGIAIALPDRDLRLSVDDRLHDRLAPRLVELTEHLRIARGIVFDIATLRSLEPREAARLAPHHLRLDATDDLLALRRVHNLDLRGSPALHSATFLRRLGELPRLRTLQLDARQLDRDGIAAIVALGGLNELFFAHWSHDFARHFDVPHAPNAAAIDDAAIFELSKLTELSELSMPGTSITDAGAAVLGRMPKLTRLVLSQASRITDEGIAALSGSPIKVLDVRGTPVRGSTLSKLTQLETLALSVATTQPAHEDLGWIADCASLENVIIDGGGRERTDDAWPDRIAAIISGPKVRSLFFLNAPIVDADLMPLMRDGVQMGDIGFASCPGMTNAFIERLDARDGFDAFRMPTMGW